MKQTAFLRCFVIQKRDFVD